MATQLSGLDAAFLEAETPTIHLHAMGIVRLQASDEPLTVDELTELVRRRLHRLPALRHRLATVPAGLDQPYWVDAVPDLAEHIEHVELDRHDRAAFEALVGRLAQDHLDRTRPLWRFWLVDGLPDGQQALVIKMHHSVSDGVGSLALVGELLDLEPHPAEDDPADAPADEPGPRPLWLLWRAVARGVQLPLVAARVAGELGSSLLRLGRVIGHEPRTDLGTPLVTPRLASSGTATAARCIAVRELPLDRMRVVAHAAGVRINDVVLATLAGGMRRWLLDHDDLPEQPLVAAVPVSTRGPDELTAPGNHVSACFVHLATNVEDPLERLQATSLSSAGAKAVHAAVGPKVMEHVAALALPITVVTMLRLYSGLGLPALHPPAVNLVVSNVAGPQFPLYLAGHRSDGFWALGPILDGAPLNVTAVSYDGRVGLGYVACPDLVPDLDDLADDQIRAFEELEAALGT